MQSAGRQSEREEECKDGERRQMPLAQLGSQEEEVGTQAPWVSMLQGKFAACTTDLNTGQMSETEGGSSAHAEAAAD